MINRAERLAEKGDIDRAISALNEAQELAPKLQIAAHSWYTVCLNGSIKNRANEVMYACEHAVELAPDNGIYRDSRGIARALTNDNEGAIEDFQTYLKWGKENGKSEENLSERRAWIKQIMDNRAPFNLATLKASQK